MTTVVQKRERFSYKWDACRGSNTASDVAFSRILFDRCLRAARPIINQPYGEARMRAVPLKTRHPCFQNTPTTRRHKNTSEPHSHPAWPRVFNPVAYASRQVHITFPLGRNALHHLKLPAFHEMFDNPQQPPLQHALQSAFLRSYLQNFRRNELHHLHNTFSKLRNKFFFRFARRNV